MLGRRSAVGLLAFASSSSTASGGRDQSTPMVDPEHPLRDRRHRRSAVLLPARFVHRLPRLRLVHDAADERDGCVRDGQAVDVEVRLSRGPQRDDALHVPAHRPVRLLITSRDVIHSFFVPDFRMKQDALPGRYTETWFEATSPGSYQVLCAEYCGTWHSQMRGEVVVMPPAEFDAGWRAAARGRRTAVDTGGDDGGELRGTHRRARASGSRGRRAASSATRVDGTPHIGPTLLDLYHRNETLENGQTVVADEAYLTESMMDPRGKSWPATSR